MHAKATISLVLLVTILGFTKPSIALNTTDPVIAYEECKQNCTIAYEVCDAIDSGDNINWYVLPISIVSQVCGNKVLIIYPEIVRIPI